MDPPCKPLLIYYYQSNYLVNHNYSIYLLLGKNSAFLQFITGTTGSYNMPSISDELHTISESSLKSAALVASILSQAGVVTATWSLRAAILHGGDLVPLVCIACSLIPPSPSFLLSFSNFLVCSLEEVNTSIPNFSQDIEIILHDKDQERAFIILTSHGLIPSLPDDSDTPLHPYTSFVNWRQEYASPSQYRDRRRLRHGAPIYETPPQPANSDPKTTFTPRMLIILYSAEFAGLAPISSQHSDSPGDTRFIPLAALQKSTDIPNCLVPTFQSLVESEIHVLLQDPNHPSPTWCQHAAQLASLVCSGSCPGGMDGLADFVSPQFQPFAIWLQRSQKGMTDHGALKRMRRDFGEPGKSSKSSFCCMA